MASKSNDFASLLSVFRDATAPNEPSTSQSSASAAASSKSPAGVPKTNLNEDKPKNASSTDKVALSSTSDPSFSAPVIKGHIERLLRIHQIRKSTSAAGKSDDAVSDSDTRHAVHVAICATIVDNFPHERLWRKWIEETAGDIEVLVGDPTDGKNDAKSNGESATCEPKDYDQGNVNSTSPIHKNSMTTINATAEMYIHAKNPENIQSEWLRSKTLPITHRPSWNDVRIIRAMLSLLEAALCDERTTHILFCTESCIPVVTLKEAARSILLDEPCVWEEIQGGNSDQPTVAQERVNWDKSYVDCYDRSSQRCSRYDEHNCFGHLRDSIPGEAIYKALPGWCLLSRKHAQHILDLPTQLGGMNLWPAFEKVWAPEEVYFPTALNICGLMDEVVRRSVTHSKWDHKAANLQDRAHPLCYDGYFDDGLVRQLREDGCLFLRKMKHSIDIDAWQDIVIERRKCRAREMSESYDRSKRKREWDDDRNRSHHNMGNHRSNRVYNRSDRDGSYHSSRDYNNRRSYHSSRYRRDDDQHWKRRR